MILGEQEIWDRIHERERMRDAAAGRVAAHQADVQSLHELHTAQRGLQEARKRAPADIAELKSAYVEGEMDLHEFEERLSPLLEVLV